MMVSSKITELFKVMYKLTAIEYRRSLKKIIPNISKFNDAQVFELMHAVNTGINFKKLANPNMPAKMIKQARVDAEFSKQIANVDYDNIQSDNEIIKIR